MLVLKFLHFNRNIFLPFSFYGPLSSTMPQFSSGYHYYKRKKLLQVTTKLEQCVFQNISFCGRTDKTQNKVLLFLDVEK